MNLQSSNYLFQFTNSKVFKSNLIRMMFFFFFAKLSVGLSLNIQFTFIAELDYNKN